jgi:hypothetical protein
VLTKIVSGGETGVDRGALDAALAARFPCGGWCMPDRTADDGLIAEGYPVTPIAAGGYRQRTRQNVIDSDGTLILHHECLKGGTRLTRNLCALEKKPFIILDAQRLPHTAAADAAFAFVQQHHIGVLNVAGPRLRGWAEGHAFSLAVVAGLIAKVLA